MKARILFGTLTGSAAGFLAGWLLSPDTFSRDPAGPDNRIVWLEQELEMKTREIERLTKFSETRMVPAANPSATPAPAEILTSADAARAKDRLKRQVRDKLKLRLDERTAALRVRLGLNDAQAAAVRTLLEKNPGGPQPMVVRVITGSDSMDEEATRLSRLPPREQAAELAASINELLTPGQQQDYAVFRQEQRTNEIEVKAGRELARLQSTLTLTPEQKDKAFAALASLADQEYDRPLDPLANIMALQLQNLPHDPNADNSEPLPGGVHDEANLATRRRQQRIEALRSILSPEQLTLYEDQQKRVSMAEYLDGALQGMPESFLTGSGEPEPAETPGPSPVLKAAE